MKNYMVTHTFKSAEMKKKFSDTVASMKIAHKLIMRKKL